MLEILYLLLVTLAGLILLGTGLCKPFTQRIRSAGLFDIIVGSALLLYALPGAILDIDESTGFLFAYVGYTVSGIYLYRRYHVLAAESDRRSRDVLQALFLVIPGAGGMLAILVSRVFVLFLFLPALPLGLAGIVLLAADGRKAIRGEHVYRRDIVVGVALVSMIFVYVRTLPSLLVA